MESSLHTFPQETHMATRANRLQNKVEAERKKEERLKMSLLSPGMRKGFKDGGILADLKAKREGPFFRRR
jgi:hypothetical protein